MNVNFMMSKRTTFGLGRYRYLLPSDKEILMCQSLGIKTQYNVGRRLHETEQNCQPKTHE